MDTLLWSCFSSFILALMVIMLITGFFTVNIKTINVFNDDNEDDEDEDQFLLL